ncbi:MAG: tRNA (adenosine(37)-N6)-threonylcarbamoyltransferase complex ATPase subunit type 1 TsaE [Gammaproteobacteria bacterium]|nr:tRNA (adenosine(37)-N6)-threonylcarbamoyltransferase complex ATPase subunit type 1 TsaE [Gammaproteobacteria bacterium]
MRKPRTGNPASCFCCPTAEDLEALGARIASRAQPPLTIFLCGELGVGKTTFARGFIRGCGHQGQVKSPTFTLVEPYDTPCGIIYHFDLFRVSDPDELELAGLREYFASDSIRLIEWPERAAGWLRIPDLTLEILATPGGRTVDAHAASDNGTRLLAYS